MELQFIRAKALLMIPFDCQFADKDETEDSITIKFSGMHPNNKRAIKDILTRWGKDLYNKWAGREEGIGRHVAQLVRALP